MGQEISGKDLAKLIRINPRQYDKFSLPRFGGGHSYLEPREIFSDGKVITNFPVGVERVSRGKYKSGDVWMDTFYDVMSLYIGKTHEGKDLVIRLGGDTPNAGQLEQGVINSEEDEDGRIFFDRKLFP